MLAHCRARRLANRCPVRQLSAIGHLSAGDTAARAQAHGFAQLKTLSTVRRNVSLPSMSGSNSPSTPLTPALSPLPLPSETLQLPSVPVSQLTAAEKEAEELARDLRTVKNELHRWKEDPLAPDDAPFDLVRFWDVSQTFQFLEMALNELTNSCIGIRDSLSATFQSRP